MTRVFAISILLISFAADIYAGNGGPSVSRHQCRDINGGSLWEAAVRVAPAEGKAGCYLLTEEGKGLYSGFEGITACKSELEFIDEKTRLAPVRMKRQVFSGDGKLILEAAQKFDAEKREVECEVRDLLKGKEKKRRFKYKGDIVNSLMMGRYIRRFLEAGEKEKTVYLVSNDASLYRVTLKIAGSEEIIVRGKKRRAYKICVDPNIGLLSPAKVFIPGNYDWYSCEPPYEWLKFRGLESSINSPVVEITPLDG